MVAKAAKVRNTLLKSNLKFGNLNFNSSTPKIRWSAARSRRHCSLVKLMYCSRETQMSNLNDTCPITVEKKIGPTPRSRWYNCCWKSYRKMGFPRAMRHQFWKRKTKTKFGLERKSRQFLLEQLKIYENSFQIWGGNGIFLWNLRKLSQNSKYALINFEKILAKFLQNCGKNFIKI